eukprot:403352515
MAEFKQVAIQTSEGMNALAINIQQLVQITLALLEENSQLKLQLQQAENDNNILKSLLNLEPPAQQPQGSEEQDLNEVEDQPGPQPNEPE